MTTQIEDLRKEISAMDKQAQEGRDKLSLYRVKLQQKEVGPGIASGKDFNPTFTSEVFYLPKQRDSMQLERLLDEKTNTSKVQDYSLRHTGMMSYCRCLALLLSGGRGCSGKFENHKGYIDQTREQRPERN
mmetsp:Transcript_25008/g.98775  ORF Transcript_25008/g.98775 Transcript_25008/m.98775 type:complete len:131 (-) Transcript_25008:2108-2500(-)